MRGKKDATRKRSSAKKSNITLDESNGNKRESHLIVCMEVKTRLSSLFN